MPALGTSRTPAIRLSNLIVCLVDCVTPHGQGDLNLWRANLGLRSIAGDSVSGSGVVGTLPASGATPEPTALALLVTGLLSLLASAWPRRKHGMSDTCLLTPLSESQPFLGPLEKPLFLGLSQFSRAPRRSRGRRKRDCPLCRDLARRRLQFTPSTQADPYTTLQEIEFEMCGRRVEIVPPTMVYIQARPARQQPAEQKRR